MVKNLGDGFPRQPADWLAMTTLCPSEAGGQKETISGSGLAAAVMEVT